MEKNITVGKHKIAAFFDSGTFVETGAYMKRASGEMTGVVCGYGAVDGRLVYAFAQDSDRKKGAFDAVGAEKIAMLYDMALKNGAPVVGMFDSAGAVVSDGAGVMSAYGKLLKCVSDASGVIPQIALISGVCAGLAATVASMFDVTVTVKEKSQLFVNAPFLVGKDTGDTEAVAKSGLASIVTENEADASAQIRRLLSFLPSHRAEGVVESVTADDVNRTVAIDGVVGREMIRTVADGGEFLEITSEHASGMLTGLIRLGGVTCGVIANDASEQNGTVSAIGARLAARWIGFCDRFGIPVITLVDSTGVEASREAEDAPLASQLGKLAMAYATSDVPKITAIVGNAYGAAFSLMGSKALGADMVYALPSSVISVMAPASAVAFLWNDRITEDVTREQLEAEWTAEQASAVAAAADGSIDDVIEPAELRQRLCSAVYMLLSKNAIPSVRKHFNLPL